MSICQKMAIDKFGFLRDGKVHFEDFTTDELKDIWAYMEGGATNVFSSIEEMTEFKTEAINRGIC